MIISAYLSMTQTILPESMSEAARKAGGEWVVVNAIDGRQLVSCLAPESAIIALMTLLLPYSPSLLGVWGLDGTPIDGHPIKTAEYLSLMPDDVATTGVDDLPVLTRPTTARDVCLWAGWEPRRFE